MCELEREGNIGMRLWSGMKPGDRQNKSLMTMRVIFWHQTWPKPLPAQALDSASPGPTCKEAIEGPCQPHHRHGCRSLGLGVEGQVQR